jgi:tRNA threonylcarbamoyladenosine biosynthesis protein TsaE
MIQEHHGRFPLYHIDLYRLEEATLDDLGLREYLFSEGVAAVEWFERLRGGAEMEYLSVRISYAGANLRRIEFSAGDSRHAQIISKLKRGFA